MKNTLKPYIINAFYSWCMDYQFVPLILVSKDDSNILPGHIENLDFNTFNIHPRSIKNLIFEKNYMIFFAMFDRNEFEVKINYDAISSIFVDQMDYKIDFMDLFENYEKVSEKLKKYKQSVDLEKENKIKNFVVVRAGDIKE